MYFLPCCPNPVHIAMIEKERANDPKDRRRTIVEPIRNKKLERKLEMIFIPLHEKMHKLLSPYSDSELAFLLEALTKTIELTHEESKRSRSLKM